MEQIKVLRPETPDELHRFVSVVLGLRVPRRAVMEGSTPPFEYLVHTFFEGNDSGGGDLVVWASRGGGKTYLGAVATLLDMVFKAGIQVRILGGSLEQSSKMFRYLRQMFDLAVLRGLVVGTPTQRGVELINGSRAELLSQSQRSVRGQRVHKLRCDEVEDFKSDIWEAAQLVTRSGVCGDVAVKGTVEALSTMHRPFGLMHRLIERSAAGGCGQTRVMRWCALDVIERCAPERECGSCVLWKDCQGRAKEAEGFVSVDDLVTQWHRSSGDTWASEMMCRRPRHGDGVYPGFDPASGGKHVLAVGVDDDEVCEGGVPGVMPPGDGEILVGGMDFGLRSPFVMLWARVGLGEDLGGDRVGDEIVIVDEYVERGLTLDEHLDVIGQRDWPELAWVGVDPAGGQRNSHTGLSDVQILRRRGYQVRVYRSMIREGIESIRRRLDHGGLRVHPRCRRLIEAMVLYHFDPNHPSRDDPVKDGPDHVCDALRYLVISLERGASRLRTRSYL